MRLYATGRLPGDDTATVRCDAALMWISRCLVAGLCLAGILPGTVHYFLGSYQGLTHTGTALLAVFARTGTAGPPAVVARRVATVTR